MNAFQPKYEYILVRKKFSTNTIRSNIREFPNECLKIKNVNELNFIMCSRARGEIIAKILNDAFNSIMSLSVGLTSIATVAIAADAVECCC